MQSAEQAKQDAEKLARHLQGLLEAITELQAANVRTVYGAIVR